MKLFKVESNQMLFIYGIKQWCTGFDEFIVFIEHSNTKVYLKININSFHILNTQNKSQIMKNSIVPTCGQQLV